MVDLYGGSKLALVGISVVISNSDGDRDGDNVVRIIVLVTGTECIAFHRIPLYRMIVVWSSRVECKLA